MEGRHHIHKHDPRWHFPFKMVGLGPPINQILCVFFFCAVGALHFVERDLLIHTQHHFIWEQDQSLQNFETSPGPEKKRDDHYFGPVYLTTSVGRYFMKPDCQMHKMQKCEICKDCLRDFKKKFHSRQAVYKLVAQKRLGCDHRVALCLTKWFSHFSQFFGHYVNIC